MAVYGTQAPASINNLTLYGNEIDHNTTGCSENVSFDGNVQYWVMANNKVHDGDNIGLDNIGFEGVSPTRLPVSGIPAPASLPSSTRKPNSRERTPG